MQNAAFAAAGLDWDYVALDVAPADLERAVRGLVADGFAGANVTIPHKRAAALLCDEPDGPAVNTLVFAARADPRLQHRPGDRRRDRVHARLPDRRRRRGRGAAARAPRRGAPLLAARRVAPGRGRLRPDRQRDAGARRAARHAPGGADRGRARLRGRARPPSSPPRAPRAARWWTGRRRSSGRAPGASSCGPECRLPSTSCARRSAADAGAARRYARPADGGSFTQVFGFGGDGEPEREHRRPLRSGWLWPGP